MKRTLLAAALLAAGLVLVATPAQAQYDGEVEGITLGGGEDGGAGCAGGPLTATVTGAAPGSTVTFTFESQPTVLGTATADSSGTAVFEGTWPSAASPGAQHNVRATGTAADGGPLDVLATNVCPTEASGAAALPRTGSNSTDWVRPAIILLTVGAVFVVLARRRKALVTT